MTSTTLREERVLKTDVLGRVKTPPERREALLDEFEKSGMSGVKFAQFIGVKYQTWAPGCRCGAGSGAPKSDLARRLRCVLWKP